MFAMTTVLIAFLSSAGFQEGRVGSVTLVQDGRPVSVIVIADRATRAAREGAEDLQMWIERASDATVPIKTESEISDGSPGKLILAGDAKRTRSLGIEPDAFDLEEIAVRSFPGALAIVGDDERPDDLDLQGTLYAVHAFAEEILSV